MNETDDIKAKRMSESSRAEVARQQAESAIVEAVKAKEAAEAERDAALAAASASAVTISPNDVGAMPTEIVP